MNEYRGLCESKLHKVERFASAVPRDLIVHQRTGFKEYPFRDDLKVLLHIT